MLAQPFRLSRATRVGAEAVADKWLKEGVTGNELVSGYHRLALGAFKIRTLDLKKDAELCSRAVLLSNIRGNSLLQIARDPKLGAEPNFKPLENDDLVNFQLDPDARYTASSKRGSTNQGSSFGPTGGNSRKRSPSHGSDGGRSKKARTDDGGMTVANVANQAVLDSVLRSALKDLENCKFRPNPMKHLPKGNPFCLRLETGQVAEQYFQVISEPCDLVRVSERLKMDKYKSIDDFERDIKLMIENAYEYYNPKEALFKMAKQFERHAAIVLKKARRKLLDV